jgi:hypothetical protein
MPAVMVARMLKAISLLRTLCAIHGGMRERTHLLQKSSGHLFSDVWPKGDGSISPLDEYCVSCE